MIIGHNQIIEDLKKLAKSGELSHGYIFSGSSMVGKRLVAWSFANYLETGKFEEGKILQDATLIRPDDKGTLGIDAMRKLKNFLWQKPVWSPRRTAVIDGVELMTQEAQNALLKIAEEPPASTLLILVTNDLEALAPTLRSRLAQIYFPVVPKSLVLRWLGEEHRLPKKTAQDLAGQSFGKPGFASRLMNDKKLQAYLKSADTLLKLSRDKRRDFIKGLLEDESFDFRTLLDAVILKISSDGAKNNYEFWHKLVELRGEAAYFNLNPRLQMENLFIN